MSSNINNDFKNHMIEKYSNIIDVEKALTIFDKEVDSIKIGTKEDKEIKVPIKCDMNKNIFLKCLSDYLKKEGLIYDKGAKTTSIVIEDYKSSDQYFEACSDLFSNPNKDLNEEPESNKICYEWFEHGEYGSFEIIIDENMNIVGGKVIKSGKK